MRQMGPYKNVADKLQGLTCISGVNHTPRLGGALSHFSHHWDIQSFFFFHFCGRLAVTWMRKVLWPITICTCDHFSFSTALLKDWQIKSIVIQSGSALWPALTFLFMQNCHTKFFFFLLQGSFKLAKTVLKCVIFQLCSFQIRCF